MTTVTRDNAARIYACNIGTERGNATLELMGFVINNLGDAYRIQSEAYALLKPAELRHQQKHDRVRLNYVASAVKTPVPPEALPKFAPWFDEPAVE